jgi:hypothetical protein
MAAFYRWQKDGKISAGLRLVAATSEDMKGTPADE